VSMTCTRGRPTPGSRDLRTARNTFYCYAVPFVWISSPDRQATGATMRISPITRIPPQSVDPSVKNYHWLDLDLALLDAYDHDAELVVLRDLSGAITEGPGFNVFAHVAGRRADRGGQAERGRPAPGGRGAGHLDGRRDHAGDGDRRRAGWHRRPGAVDAGAARTVLGQPSGPSVFHAGSL
jgi:hypothetical protein